MKIELKDYNFVCPSGHTLECDPSYLCLKCGIQKPGLACQICKFHVCYSCFGVDLGNFNSKSEYCLLRHQLKFNHSPLNCIKCDIKFDDGLACVTCKLFYICRSCLGFDRSAFKPNSTQCFFEHALIFTGVPIKCIYCEAEFPNGLKCSICQTYFICISCSKFSFPTKGCPSSQKLFWDEGKKKCSRCFIVKTGFECPHCNYRLCSLCRFPSLFENHSEVNLESATPLIVSGSYDNCIKIWSGSKDECLRTFNGHKDSIFSVIKLNNKLIASGSGDSSIKIWNTLTGECLKTLNGHRKKVSCLIKLNENQIASGSSDNSIKIWNFSTGVCIRSLNCNFRFDDRCVRPISNIVLLKISENLIASSGKYIKIWHYKRSKLIRTLKACKEIIFCMIKLKDEKIAYSNRDKSIKISDCLNGECLITLTGHTKFVLCLVELRDNQIASAGLDRSIKIWNYSKGECVLTFDGLTKDIYCLLETKENELASGGEDSSIKIWDYSKGECLKTYYGHTNWVLCLTKL